LELLARSRMEAAYFILARRQKACLLARLQLSTAVRDFPTLAADRRTARRSFPATAVAAYDESMAESDGKKRVRWSLWLAAGVLFGLAIGFVFGLARPRVRN
jgi:hypothetical protein